MQRTFINVILNIQQSTEKIESMWKLLKVKNDTWESKTNSMPESSCCRNALAYCAPFLSFKFLIPFLL